LIHTVVQQVEEWYAKHSERISQTGICSSIRFKDSTDITKGKVEIRIETPVLLVSLTFWNHGSVTALAVEKPSRTEHIFDDRRLESADSVQSLLDRYLHQINNISSRTASN
jgi:hypothetical protein